MNKETLSSGADLVIPLFGVLCRLLHIEKTWDLTTDKGSDIPKKVLTQHGSGCWYGLA